MIPVKWPQGRASSLFYSRVQAYAKQILTTKLLAVDPASGKTSKPGYAYYEAGKLLESGVIDVPVGNTGHRLADLYSCVAREFTGIDILVVEQLRGPKISPVLHWATGVTVAAVNAPILYELPIYVWKAWAKTLPDYTKADDQDARAIGDSILALARTGHV